MTAPWMFRSLAAALFAVCVGLATLPGCGGPAPKGDKKDDKKDEPKPDPNANPTPPNPTPGPTPITPPPGPPKNTLGPVDDKVMKTAMDFLSALMQGAVKVDSLTLSFTKAIGKPVVLPSEKEKGFSPDAAADWLRKVGAGVLFGMPMLHNRADDIVYFRGPFSGMRLGNDPKKTGSYSLRLVKDGDAWKIDWLSLSSVTAPDRIQEQVTTTPTPEGMAQAFAVASFIESVADVDGMPRDERAAVIAAAMSPALRVAWAPPSDQHKAQGYDYHPGILGTKAIAVGGGTSTFTAAREGDLPEFKVELTKPAGKKVYVVRLVKGAAPHEWLVNEVLDPKG